MYKFGLVSVIIPTYKRHDMLARAIRSALNQTYSHLEVIVVNDNDPDDDYTADARMIAERFDDSRLCFLTQPSHKNGAAARNYGIRSASGEFIAFLDDDDFWFPNKIAEQVSTLGALGDEYAACSTLVLHCKNKMPVMATLPYRDGSIMRDILLRRAGLGTCSVMVRHEQLDACGLFDESLSRHQEIQLLAGIAKQYKIHLIKEHLTGVDMSDGSNRPDPKRFIEVKQSFYGAVSPLVSLLSRSDQRCFYAMHEFEILNSCIKARNFAEGSRHVTKVLSSPKAIAYTFERAAKRWFGIKFMRSVLSKYTPSLSKTEIAGYMDYTFEEKQ